MNAASDVWIFGYGSLIWRPEFPWVERHPAYIEGWTRRFWQGSPDHRGSPETPGRVVTLTRDAHGRCWGMAYRVHTADVPVVMQNLDQREIGGYERVPVLIHMTAAPDGIAGQTYLATHENPHYLGPASVETMVAQILAGRGQSGPNHEYVLRLAASLRELGADDPHVFELADRLSAFVDKVTGES